MIARPGAAGDGYRRVHVLGGDSYRRTEQSALFPHLDVAALCSFLDRPTALQAVRAFRDTLR
jgi:hypothetical protein